jgi:hypothetical protein
MAFTFIKRVYICISLLQTRSLLLPRPSESVPVFIVGRRLANNCGRSYGERGATKDLIDENKANITYTDNDIIGKL